MARSRVIHPAFFHDAELVATSPTARLLFIGLWTLADRAGRLQDRPPSIKLAVLPGDDVDVDGLLNELVQAGCIRRYRTDGMALIDIPAFAKYQHIHHREAESALPAFKAKRIRNPRFAGKPGQARTSPGKPGQAPAQPGASTSTSTSVKSIDALPGVGGDETMSNPRAVGTNPRAVPFDFSEFWKAYPNKQGKVAALRTWRHLTIEERRNAYRVAKRMTLAVEAGFRTRALCPHGSTFLNQRRWEEWYDEGGQTIIPPGYGPDQQPNSNPTTEERRPTCIVCNAVMGPDDLLDGVHTGKGWRHDCCPEEER